MGDKARGRRDPDKTREALLDAALIEFSAHGRSGARTSAIAQRARVNKQLISHHFGGKDGLYRALIERWLQQEAMYHSPDSSLADVAAAYVTDGLRHRVLHRLLLRASLEGEESGAGLDTGDVEDLRRRQAAGEVSSQLDPAFVVLALQAIAALGLVFPGDVRWVCGLDPASDAFASWNAEQLRRLIVLLQA